MFVFFPRAKYVTGKTKLSQTLFSRQNFSQAISCETITFFQQCHTSKHGQQKNVSLVKKICCPHTNRAQAHPKITTSHHSAKFQLVFLQFLPGKVPRVFGLLKLFLLRFPKTRTKALVVFLTVKIR